MQKARTVYDEIALLAEETEGGAEATGKALALLNENPQDSQALFLLGYIFAKADNHGIAYQVLRRCVELAPNEPIAWHNLGKACYELNQPEQAETAWRRALALEPNSSATLDALGLIHLGRSEYDRAIDYCQRALAVEPDMVDSRVNLGMANLACGRWREGWAGYDANVGNHKDRKERDMPVPRWDGAKGKRIFCRTDQGVGDELSFASCLPDLIRDSASVVIECDRRTLGIYKRSFPTCQVYGTRYNDKVKWPERHEFDARVLQGELPRFYRNEDKDFPGTPYLVAAPELRLQFRALFDSMSARPKIGIAWNGGKPHTNMKRRSMSLEALLPILKQDADFISLEYRPIKPEQVAQGQEPILDEIASAQKKHGVAVTHWPWAVQNYDYDVTLALLAELDLVISVTTTVIHAAGGLGKPVWCLVPEQVMWRYGATGSKFPWASSVELWRQRNGEWPLEEMATKLKGWINAFDGKRHRTRGAALGQAA